MLARPQTDEAWTPDVCARTALPDVETLYREHARFVWRVLRRLGVPDADLDDAAHQVFLVVHRRHADLGGAQYVRAWLFGIARRVSLQVARRGRRSERDATIVGPLGVAEDPEHAAVARERARTAKRLLGALPESLRLPFILFALEDMSAPEIAATLDLNVNTVYSRVRRAREALTRAVARERLRAEAEG